MKIFQAYKYFWSILLVLLGMLVMFLAGIKFGRLASEMRLIVADQLAYLACGIGFIVMGIVMFFGIKKGKI